MSMHPRVENGRTVHPKVNTAKPSQKLGKPARKVIANFDRRIQAHNTTIKSVKQPEAFRKPGSRNPRV